MTSQAQTVSSSHADVRTIVGGGAKLGLVSAVVVVVFALVSRALGAGTAETVVQLQLVIAGGVLAAYLPASWVRPMDADTIAWSALVGLLGAVTFTVIDTALLRPLDLYHWRWDEIGGGSGFWYIPVWWMLSAVLAWLGAWVYAQSVTPTTGDPPVAVLALQTAVGAEVLYFLLVLTQVVPFHSSAGGLALALVLVAHIAIAKALSRR